MNHSMSESSSYYLYVTSFLKDNIPIGIKIPMGGDEYIIFE